MGFPKPVSVSGATYMKFGHRKDYKYVYMWGTPVPGGTYDVDDYACAFIRFANGATINLEVSWAANLEKEVFHSIILGDKGGAKLDAFEPLNIYTDLYGKNADVQPLYAKEENYLNQMRHFIDCIANNRKPIAPGEHGLAVQKVLDAVYLSGQTKREVVIK
jgi:predicted dehydrogenase